MKLNNIQDIIAQTAEDEGISRNLVKFVIEDFESNLRTAISKPEGATIYLDGFALFQLSINRCKIKLEKDDLTGTDLREFFKKLEDEKREYNH